MKRCCLLLAVIFLSSVGVTPQIQAQEREQRASKAISTEQEMVISALRTAFSIIQDITRRHAGEPISEQLQLLSGRVSTATDGYGGFRTTDTPTEGVIDLSDLLVEIRREIRRIARDLDRNGEDDLADSLVNTIDEMDRAIRMAMELEREYTPVRNGRSLDDDLTRIRINSNSGDRRVDSDRRSSDRDFNWRRHSSAFVGEFTHRWPFGESAQYRPIPALRYTRVEGLVLGVRRLPLDWSDYERGRIYGQVGYAFSLEDWRYEVGLETKLSDSYRNSDFDLKIGGAYRRDTSTPDLWKTSWAENSLAAGLFRHDFFDYYQTEGWTAYAIGKVTPYVQYSVGYRDDEYRSLRRETNWSLFNGDPFRLNPAIQEGQMKSVVTTLEGGRVRGYRSHPAGFAFRLEAEFGKGMGGDFSFNRYVGDVRTYARMGRYAGLSLRFRAGYADGSVPFQKAFTLGGVGSVRAYGQNTFYGTRMLLANAEYTLYRQRLLDDILEDFVVFGIFDAGWTNTIRGDAFETRDIFSAAGFGIALGPSGDDRTIRLEVAWPLKDFGTGLEPSVWLRLNPTF